MHHKWLFCVSLIQLRLERTEFHFSPAARVAPASRLLPSNLTRTEKATPPPTPPLTSAVFQPLYSNQTFRGETTAFLEKLLSHSEKLLTLPPPRNVRACVRAHTLTSDHFFDVSFLCYRFACTEPRLTDDSVAASKLVSAR